MNKTGFWPQLARPVLAWLFACMLTGFLVGGYMTVNFLRPVQRHLHEIDWLAVLSEQPQSMLIWWLSSAGAIALVTAVPVLLLVLLVRAVALPRGWADVMISAFLPYFTIAGAMASTYDVGGERVWMLMIDIIPVGALGGLVYWLAAGTPSSVRVK